MQLPALLISDLHLTAAPSTEYRWSLFPWLVKQIEEHRVRSLLILGDLTDAKDNHSAELVNRVVKALASLTCQVTVLAGNHDWLKQGQEFFRFLNYLGHVKFIADITEESDKDGPLVCFLPYSKNPARDWQGRDFSHFQYLFLHQTVKGAVASNGQEMDGEELPALNAQRVFSGDIHVPQNIGGLTYVGSPYHVHFGDKFKPRCILIDRRGRESDLHFETVARVAVKVSSLRELKRLHFNQMDQVKLRIALDEADRHGWAVLRRQALDYLAQEGVVVSGVELIVAKRDKQAGVRGSKGRAVLSAPDAVMAYVSREELGGSALEAALEVLEEEK